MSILGIRWPGVDVIVTNAVGGDEKHGYDIEYPADAVGRDTER